MGPYAHDGRIVARSERFSHRYVVDLDPGGRRKRWRLNHSPTRPHLLRLSRAARGGFPYPASSLSSRTMVVVVVEAELALPRGWTASAEIRTKAAIESAAMLRTRHRAGYSYVLPIGHIQRRYTCGYAYPPDG